MRERIYNSLPNFLQDLLIYIYNKRAYSIRYGGAYKEYRREKFNNRNFSREELLNYQKDRYKRFIDNAIENSLYYKITLGGIESANQIENISKLPIVNKETLRTNIQDIVAKTDEKLSKSKTGGTTGKS